MNKLYDVRKDDHFGLQDGAANKLVLVHAFIKLSHQVLKILNVNTTIYLKVKWLSTIDLILDKLFPIELEGRLL